MHRVPSAAHTRCAVTTSPIVPRVSQRHVLPLLAALAIVALTACDQVAQVRSQVRSRLSFGSQAAVDSLSRENAALRRQMVLFERISAEKDTLLREVRDAHILIEAIAEELQRMDGMGMDIAAAVLGEGTAPADTTAVAAQSVAEPAAPTPVVTDPASIAAAAGDIAVEPVSEVPPGESTYREAMLRKLELVRHRLGALEDSARARGERLLEATRDNDRLRAEVEEHLRTIDGQKEMIAIHLVRIAELETQVSALADSTRRLTEENGLLADSLYRLTARANTAWYVMGTREELVEAGILSEEGGLLGFGRSLAPARSMARNAFTRIDRTRDTVLPLPNAREYRIVSRHDPSLVSITASRGGGTVRIDDPERFWSASNWLIVVYED